MTAATTTPEPPKGTVRLWLDRWGDYICQVDPHPVGERLDRVFWRYEDAREYGRMLASSNGWQLVDEVAKAAAA